MTKLINLSTQQDINMVIEKSKKLKKATKIKSDYTNTMKTFDLEHLYFNGFKGHST